MSKAYARYPVAPFMGAWIEMLIALYLLQEPLVAPFMGAWIEIINVTAYFFNMIKFSTE